MTKITDISQLDLTKQYTYADYLTWWFDERVELIRGYVRKMSPAPLDRHQRVIGNVYNDIKNFIRRKKCQVRFAPYDVRLTRNIDDKKVVTVVQPDICIICNTDLIDEKGCNGAPDMIAEILSPGNAKHDVKTKFELYQEAGVKEYWLVDTTEKLVDVFILENGTYRLVKKYVEDDIVPLNTLEGLNIDLKDIFDY